MRYQRLLFVDVVLILVATSIAFALRENFEITELQFEAFLPYLCATAVTSIILIPAAGLNRSIWRFSSLPDYMRASVVVIGVSLGATALCFVYDRLDYVARSLPFLQVVVGVVILIGVRVLHMLWHSARQREKSLADFEPAPKKAQEVHVLIVGIDPLTQIYIQALRRSKCRRISIAGIIGCTDRHVGRLVATYPVLGLPADIEGILDRLEVHGVSVRQIVVAAPFRTLPPEARVALSHVVSSRGITLQLLHETLGLEAGVEKTGEAEALSQNIPPQPTFEITPSEQQLLSKRLFWKVKRALDFLGALGILALLSPFLLLLALAVAFSIGRPVVFWQRRPGLGGRAFHLYKFRTMRPAHAPDGRRLSDGERLSRMGSFMRATRLDELPQFFNILRGDMSFVGPRPLLWQDQPQSFEARLLVRPGLTGWAQVVGGRDIPSHDKAALDVWYVRHADFFLDLNIAARTIPIVLFGERISASLIENAWRDLASCGIVKKAVVD